MGKLLPLQNTYDQIAALPHHQYIKLRIRKVQCIQVTDPQTLFGVPVADEVAIGGVAIYPDFSTKLIPMERLGEYNSGETKKDVEDKLVGMTLNKPATFTKSGVPPIRLYFAILLFLFRSNNQLYIKQ